MSATVKKARRASANGCPAGRRSARRLGRARRPRPRRGGHRRPPRRRRARRRAARPREGPAPHGRLRVDADTPTRPSSTAGRRATIIDRRGAALTCPTPGSTTRRPRSATRSRSPATSTVRATPTTRRDRRRHQGNSKPRSRDLLARSRPSDRAGSLKRVAAAVTSLGRSPLHEAVDLADGAAVCAHQQHPASCGLHLQRGRSLAPLARLYLVSIWRYLFAGRVHSAVLRSRWSGYV